MRPTSRHKLNGRHLVGNTAAAAVVASLFESWLVFAVLILTLTVASIHSGEIRLSSDRER